MPAHVPMASSPPFPPPAHMPLSLFALPKAPTHPMAPMQAAQLRRAWRDSKGAVSFAPDDVEVRVEDAHLPNPRVTIQPQLQSSAASMLVAEMMILAGEAVGTFGGWLFLLSMVVQPLVVKGWFYLPVFWSSAPSAKVVLWSFGLGHSILL